MAITVRRSAVGASAPAEGAAAPAADTPSPGIVAPSRSGPSYTPYAILGIVAVLMFAALVIMQWLELSYYTKPPSAFPVLQKLAVAPAAEQPAEAEADETEEAEESSDEAVE